jgi:hypothetical protein
MSENINPNFNPASNAVTGVLYNTQIPELSENADIQTALKTYHYGTTTPPSTNSSILANSVAGHLKSLRASVTALEELGAGTGFFAEEPADVPDGFIWIDSDSAAPVLDPDIVSIPSVARYQDAEPTTNLVNGMLWVDKDSTPLKMYVYDSGTLTWREIGV